MRVIFGNQSFFASWSQNFNKRLAFLRHASLPSDHRTIRTTLLLPFGQPVVGAYFHSCSWVDTCYLDFFVGFPSWLAKCCILPHFLRYFTLARQHHQHRFQHPPHVQPTSPASPANRVHCQHHQFLSGKVGGYLCKKGGPSHDGKK